MFKRVVILFILFSFFIFNNFCFAENYKYAYSGVECNGARSAILKFNIKASGMVDGVIFISKICNSSAHLAGGKLHFSGYLTGSYPQVKGNFKGESLPACGGKESKIHGIIKIGYHPHFKVFVQLFNANGSGGTEWYFKKTLNNCPLNPFN